MIFLLNLVFTLCSHFTCLTKPTCGYRPKLKIAKEKMNLMSKTKVEKRKRELLTKNFAIGNITDKKKIKKKNCMGKTMTGWVKKNILQ